MRNSKHRPVMFLQASERISFTFRAVSGHTPASNHADIDALQTNFGDNPTHPTRTSHNTRTLQVPKNGSQYLGFVLAGGAIEEAHRHGTFDLLVCHRCEAEGLEAVDQR